MFATLANLSFLNPWILAALMGLPALYYILRITPPAPQSIVFPAARLLRDLEHNAHTTSATPWWILLLRLLIVALIILALARPVYNPQPSASHVDIPLTLLIDNNWHAGQSWTQQMQQADILLREAQNEGRLVALVTTTRASGQTAPLFRDNLSAAEARNLIKTIMPQPWPGDVESLKNMNWPSNTQTVILSTGVSNRAFADFVDEIAQPKTFFAPAVINRPIVIKNVQQSNEDISVTILTPDNEPQSASVQAYGPDGQILATSALFEQNARSGWDASLKIPSEIRGDIRSITIRGRQSAGAVYLLEEGALNKSVGIVRTQDDDRASRLTQAPFYLEKALEPLTNVTIDNLNILIEAGKSMIILPDVGSLPPETLSNLDAWVRDGGLLLKFAGPRMSANINTDTLSPVRLREGGRALGGAIAWDRDMRFGPIADNSPLYGLSVPDGISVRSQLLAEPDLTLQEKTWATLTDGTPIITGAPLGRGLTILVHTSAEPDWSDLPLSGFFIDLLRRVLDLSGRSFSAAQFEDGLYEPVQIIDGFGRIQPPDASMQSIALSSLQEERPSSEHPPGIYARSGISKAYNAGPFIKSLTSIERFELGTIETYAESEAIDFLTPLLLAAILLFVIDAIVMLVIARGFMLRKMIPVSLMLMVIASSPSAQAQNTSEQYARDLYLAYMKSSDAQLNAQTEQALRNLSKTLTRRTSIEPAGIVGLSPDDQSLAFFPMIFWPISDLQRPLSSAELQNIQTYLNFGGTMMFDTRDADIARGRIGGVTGRGQILQGLLSNLNIPPLIPITQDHVLGRTFYLLDQFPGASSAGTLWVEEHSDSGRDGVSSVLIGSNDWSQSWAKAYVPGNDFIGRDRQHELSLRVGVNLMMYSLTGNYKKDQVHVPHILERLGQ